MSQDFCRGCGSPIQTVDPQAPGYVPETVLLSRKQLTCQRCYRIEHYGDAGTMQPGKAQIEKNIAKALQLSHLLVIVADFSDLTGTLPVWAGYLGEKPYLLVINKCDLVPSQTNYEEVKSYLDQYLKNLKMALPQRLLLVSALAGSGTTVLGEQIKRATASGDKVAFLGVTNVGKSSLIKQFLKGEGSEQLPTVSKVSGTTMGLSNWSIFKGRNTLIDTPGLVPGNRAGDLVCPECGSRLATAKITSKLWGVKPGKGLIVGGLFAVEPLGEQEVVLIAFTSAATATHRTDSAKIAGFLKTNPGWLQGVCGKCVATITWQEHNVTLEPGMDLAVAGLGWVSSRSATTRFRVTLPQGIHWEVRPALIGKKTER